MAWLASWACDCCHLVSRLQGYYLSLQVCPHLVNSNGARGGLTASLLEGDIWVRNSGDWLAALSDQVCMAWMFAFAGWCGNEFSRPEFLRLLDDFKNESEADMLEFLRCDDDGGHDFQSGGEDGGPITSKLLVNPPLTFISTALSTLSPPSGGGSPTPAMLSCAFSPKKPCWDWPEHMSSPGWTGHKWTHWGCSVKAFVRKACCLGCCLNGCE